jgi:peptidoglycan/xylan/chitin deacetylase (PgdA/CDA1 family)
MVHRTPFILPILYPSLTWRISTQQQELYLTFDDGPVPGPTQFVVETLRQFNAVATFFCIGDNVRKHNEVLRLVVENGHKIGNHTFHHLKGWATGTRAYVQDVERCADELITKSPQQPSTLFRPPYGRITRRQINALSSYRVVMWDVLSIDYNGRLDSDRCLRNTIKATRNGSIIVFHDSLKANKNLRSVLPRFLDHFSSRGFVFKPVPE